MKSYTFTARETDHGTIKFESVNDGFSGHEVLGMLYSKMDDIKRQLSGEIKPDFVKRTYITDEQDGGAE